MLAPRPFALLAYPSIRYAGLQDLFNTVYSMTTGAHVHVQLRVLDT